MREGHRVKVKVTGTKKRGCVCCMRLVCPRLKGSLVYSPDLMLFLLPTPQSQCIERSISAKSVGEGGNSLLYI